MTETNCNRYQPNFFRMRYGKLKEKFVREFMYVDDLDHHIDEILIMHGINVRFRKVEMGNPKTHKRLVLNFLMCKPKDADTIEHTIFPILHKQLKELYGEPYEAFCLDAANIILTTLGKGDIDPDEIFSRCSAEDL